MVTYLQLTFCNITAILLNVDTEIRELDQNHPYKYLGLDETDKIQHTEMKENIRKENY